MSELTQKYFLELHKSSEKDNYLYVHGVASGTETDSANDAMSLEALNIFKDHINKAAEKGEYLKLKDGHRKDGSIMSEIGDVLMADITNDNELFIKARLPLDSVVTQELKKKLDNGKQFAFSLESNVNTKDFDYQFNKATKTIKRIVKKVKPVAISVTSQPSYFPSYLEVLNKSINTYLDKAKQNKSFSKGDKVKWNSSGGIARGVVKQKISGKYSVPNSDFTIKGTDDDPAYAIEIFDGNKLTGRIVGHKGSALQRTTFNLNKSNSMSNDKTNKSSDNSDETIDKSNSENSTEANSKSLDKSTSKETGEDTMEKAEDQTSEVKAMIKKVVMELLKEYGVLESEDKAYGSKEEEDMDKSKSDSDSDDVLLTKSDMSNYMESLNEKIDKIVELNKSLTEENEELKNMPLQKKSKVTKEHLDKSKGNEREFKPGQDNFKSNYNLISSSN